MFTVLPKEDCLSGTSDSPYDLGAGFAYPGLDRASAQYDSRGSGYHGVL